MTGDRMLDTGPARRRQRSTAHAALGTLALAVVVWGVAQAQGPRPNNPHAAIDRGIIATEAAQETAGSIAVLTTKIQGLAQRSVAGHSMPDRLTAQARSLAEQVDILARDSVFENVNLIGPGASAHKVSLPGKQSYALPARELTARALGIDQLDFSSKVGARQALARSKSALRTLRGAEANYAHHARQLRGKRPAGMIGGVPRPKSSNAGTGSGGAGGLDIDALHKRLGIAK